MKRAITIGIFASRVFLLIAFCSPVILAGCGNSGGPGGLAALFANRDRGGSTFITASLGGTVQLNDEVTLSIPADSLPEDTTITIERVTELPAGEADGLSAFGQAYRFLPKGTEFDIAVPALLEMHYDATALASRGLSPETVQVCYFEESLDCYVPVNCWVDAVRNKIIAQVEHFTVYLPMAKALLPTNNEPYVGLQAPVPNGIRAGAPIYIRATVTDFDGAIAGVTLSYRKLQPVPGGGVWNTARMTRQANHQAALHTYGHLIPASFLTAADIGPGNDLEYRIEATDNLGSVRTSAVRRYDVSLTYQAGSLTVSPAVLDITAGFQRALLARGVDSNGAAFTLVPETFTMSGGTCDLTNRFAQGILLSAVTATPAGSPDQLEVGFGSESAAASVTVHPGEIESLEILDTNGLTIAGDLYLSEGSVYAFDVVGHDGYGNSIPVITSWSADAGIGSIDPDGVLDTTGAHGPGVVSASLLYATDTQNVVVQSRAKEITAFSINGVDGVIAHPFITVTLPWGTDVSGLVANFTTTGQAVTADGETQQSGVSANDFTDPVVYTVTAEDGSTQDYTVQVRMLCPYKEITGYSINGVSGVIDGSNITVQLPSGTNVDILTAEFTTTGQNVTVNGILQESSVTTNDFSELLVYHVVAEDLTYQDYIIRVHVTLDIDGLVSHFAGSLGGPGISDGIGQNARFYFPFAVATDGLNCYVTDCYNHTIRKIVKATGQVTTLAGKAGSSGYTNGTGEAARFISPWAITIVGTYLYVTDGGTIRRIEIATGTVTTLVETIAAQLGGITSDGESLYATDRTHNVILKIVISSGTVSTFAGTYGTSGYFDATGTLAQFSSPYGITCDSSYLYVADVLNNRIRKIDLATANVTTLATCRAVGITSDGLYLYASVYDRICRIEKATGNLTYIAGSGLRGTSDGNGVSSEFNEPRDITTDGIDIYVADTRNNAIRKITISTYDVTTLAGMPSSFGLVDGVGINARFDGPSGMVSDGNNIYLSDIGNNSIRKIIIDSGVVSILAGGGTGSTDGTGTAARFNQPRDITKIGNYLYVADTNNHTIRRVSITTGDVSTIAGSPGILGAVDGIGSSARFNNPSGITSDGFNLYVADRYNHTIRKILVATNQVETYAGSPGVPGATDGTGIVARFNLPMGIDSDGNNLYVADSQNYTIRTINITTANVNTLAGLAGNSGAVDGIGNNARFVNPVRIVNDGEKLFVVENYNNIIRTIMLNNRSVTTIIGISGITGSEDGIGSAARFYWPYGITTNGLDLFVADYGNHCIRKIE